MVYDIGIIGGGIVGAATFYQLQKRFPQYKIVLIEKEDILADQQTGHNSGVLHSGLYYKPGSLKALNCIQGREEIVAFSKEHGIDHDVCGKVVAAASEEELPNMNKIYEIGKENNLPGIEKITGEQLKEIEPSVEAIGGLWVPQTGIIDFRAATAKMVEIALSLNEESKLILGEEVEAINHEDGIQELITKKQKIKAKYTIFCAGLQADRMAKKDGVEIIEKVVGFRGDYYELNDEAKHKVKNLIYPVP